jgi:hypothetical protein
MRQVPDSRITQRSRILSSAQRRETKREGIFRFFVANLHTKFRTDELHGRFGTSFRTRVSELNRDSACPIAIKNQIGEGDASVYWAELRSLTSLSTPDKRRASNSGDRTSREISDPPESSTTDSLFGDLAPLPRYPD